MTFLDLEWWKFFIIIILIFMGCLLVNYILKKYNEARMEERFTRLLEKASNSQGTQIQEMSLKMEAAQLLPIPSLKNFNEDNPKNAGISLLHHEDDKSHDLRSNNSTNAIKNTKLWDLEEIIETSQKTDDIMPNKKSMTSVKQEQVDQNTENTKTKIPGSIIIKDSKVSCDMQSITLLPKDQNQTKEPVRSQELHDALIQEKRDSFLKNNNLEPKPAITNIGDITTEDSKISCNKVTELGVQKPEISQKNDTALSQATNMELHATTANNFTELGIQDPEISQKIDTALSQETHRELNATAANNSTELGLQEPETSQKIDTALSQEINRELNAIAANNSTKHGPQEPETLQKIDTALSQEINRKLNAIAANNSTKLGLQKPETSQKIDTALSHETNTELNAITANNSIKVGLQEPETSQEIYMALSQETNSELNATTPNNYSELGLQKPETSHKNDTILSQETNRELNPTAARETVKVFRNLTNSGQITEIFRIHDELLPLKASYSSLKRNNLEPTTTRETSFSKVFVKDSALADSDSTVNTLHYVHSANCEQHNSCEIPFVGISNNSSKNDNSEQNASNTTLTSTLKKINNEGGNNTITIGLLMTEISRNSEDSWHRKTNTSSLTINKFATNATKTSLGNIPIESTIVVLNGSSNSEVQSSEMSKKTEKTLHQTKRDRPLKEKELKLKSTKPSLDMNQPTRNFHALTVSDPQTSIISQSLENDIPHKSSNTSTNKYNQKLKRFWGSFLSKTPT